MNNQIKIIGIDPAPGKNSTLFSLENGFESLNIKELVDRVNEFQKEMEPVLICWDAPLTGPGESSTSIDEEGKFTQRPIEKYLSKCFKINGKKIPGISIQPYANCSHWTITRHVVGLPRVGPFDKTEVPFKLITIPLITDEYRKSIVEVHPTLAVYLWLSEFQPYKGNRRTDGSKLDEKTKRLNARRNWENLMMSPEFSFVKSYNIENGMRKEDEIGDRLDAIVAFVLGYLWIKEKNKVVAVGDLIHGQILLPSDSRIEPNQENW